MLILLIGALIIILVSWKFFDIRYKGSKEKAPFGFYATDEVSIDPITNVTTRVYYNPETGERLYIEE
ncbi:hypothetical protein A374_10173 [Fictibacillus macauensis ZFHKF-1]|uniref:Uncharacterized protein n=1 Tax=Fictibacillus macauensis ZFHKF-1 TaxID=1196324 RepID=I8AJB6_9BACL|nr:hypothetical protein [Fictibacillus macauensis]EIT85594.1 hypothetical protein A374_10173 [Fictibacillus macauensis ZFHKF-1]